MQTNSTTISRVDLFDHLCAAVDAARESAADDPRWVKAITTAWAWLLEQETYTYNPATHALEVPSATSSQTYVANGACQCKAFSQHNACWHRAAARLVRRAYDAQTDELVAEALAPAPAITPAPAIALVVKPSAQDEADELFSPKVNTYRRAA